MINLADSKAFARRLLEPPIEALMEHLQWDHNMFYLNWILRRMPARVDEALDIGCGTGDMARRLATRARHVDALDLSADMINLARASTPPNVTFTIADVTDYPLPPGRYDAITCVAVIHHVPFESTVRVLSRALRPGGLLIVLGTYLETSTTDKAWSIAAIPANIVVGVACRLLRIAGSPSWRTVRDVFGTDRPVAMSAPVALPVMTLPQIRAEAAKILPGAVIERHLFWRYSLVYKKPKFCLAASWPG